MIKERAAAAKALKLLADLAAKGDISPQTIAKCLDLTESLAEWGLGPCPVRDNEIRAATSAFVREQGLQSVIEHELRDLDPTTRSFLDSEMPTIRVLHTMTSLLRGLGDGLLILQAELRERNTLTKRSKTTTHNRDRSSSKQKKDKNISSAAIPNIATANAASMDERIIASDAASLAPQRCDLVLSIVTPPRDEVIETQLAPDKSRTLHAPAPVQSALPQNPLESVVETSATILGNQNSYVSTEVAIEGRKHEEIDLGVPGDRANLCDIAAELVAAATPRASDV